MTAAQRNKTEAAIAAIIAVRKNAPLVHCITNTVAQNFTANCLLACGATPSMTSSPQEVEYFCSHADSLLLNLGTLDEDRRKAITLSSGIAKKNNLPIVIDPVMLQISPVRQELLVKLLSQNPAIIRVNKNEAMALKALNADLSEICLVETGVHDKICYRNKILTVSNGDPWLEKITAIGCAQGALMAALLVEAKHAEIAALAGLLWTGIAGELAGNAATGPASFAVNFIDQLHCVSAEQIRQKAATQ